MLRRASAGAFIFPVGFAVPLSITRGNRVIGGGTSIVALWAAAVLEVDLFLALDSRYPQ